MCKCSQSSEGSCYTLGVWGQSCVRQELRLCPQSFATVGNFRHEARAAEAKACPKAEPMFYSARPKSKRHLETKVFFGPFWTISLCDEAGRAEMLFDANTRLRERCAVCKERQANTIQSKTVKSQAKDAYSFIVLRLPARGLLQGAP